MVVILMGVSGCGKTTVGRLLADRLGCPFRDADDDHPPANVEKMRRGEPLNEADREPWLAALNRRVQRWVDNAQTAVLACSALTRHARTALVRDVSKDDVAFVHLTGSRALIAQRLADRQHRYMPATLLDSQFATLEQPTDAVEVAIDADPEVIVRNIRAALHV